MAGKNVKKAPEAENEAKVESETRQELRFVSSLMRRNNSGETCCKFQ